MNEKEGREKVEKIGHIVCICSNYDFGYARGFLNCYEQVQPLLEKIEIFISEKESPIQDYTMIRVCYVELKEALSHFRKQMGEE